MARLLDGGSGGGADGFPGKDNGGGNPGTGTGSSNGASLPVGENGGIFASTYYLFVPVQDSITKLCNIGIYDINSFDDENDDSKYTYRSEDIVPLRVPTVRRIGLIYRDLGLAKLTVTVQATNDVGQVVSASATVQIGNNIPTDVLLTKLVDLTLVGFRPQIIISRKAGDGPLCIVSTTMIGTVEDTSL